VGPGLILITEEKIPRFDCDLLSELVFYVNGFDFGFVFKFLLNCLFG
jgi:hypothetical protein